MNYSGYFLSRTLKKLVKLYEGGLKRSSVNSGINSGMMWKLNPLYQGLNVPWAVPVRIAILSWANRHTIQQVTLRANLARMPVCLVLVVKYYFVILLNERIAIFLRLQTKMWLVVCLRVTDSGNPEEIVHGVSLFVLDAPLPLPVPCCHPGSYSKREPLIHVWGQLD